MKNRLHVCQVTDIMGTEKQKLRFYRISSGETCVLVFLKPDSKNQVCGVSQKK